MKRTIFGLVLFLQLLQSSWAVDAPDQSEESPSAAILRKYLQATQNHEDSGRGVSMQIEINAFVPKLKEHGRLSALRNISKVGQISYHVLGFQGDNTVKNQVIVRYLQAEKQGQGDQSLAITPENYRFKYKGSEKTASGDEVYAFQLSPHKKRVGLYKGDLWLDKRTCLPVLEKGRLVKNPSIFFKKVDFERKFVIQDGIAVPEHVTSTIDTRLIGRVVLDIAYSHYERDPEASSNSAEAPALAGASTAASTTN